MKFGGVVTVSKAELLMPSAVAVIVAEPAETPVARPLASIVAIAVSLLENVRGPLVMEFPY